MHRRSKCRANRTAGVSATLKIGEVGQTITVEETPLVNAVDTTNGFVLEKQQLDAIPLPASSFTGVAILSPGVNAELAPGTGANSGLSNQPIWANGQRNHSEQRIAVPGYRPGAAHARPGTLQEVPVNISMYDAQQGSTSGAHIDMSTASGTNDIHGSD
jgi:hypothetical protein